MSTLETRLLSDSTSFALTADNWALGRGLLDSNGDPTSTFPPIIGVPNNSVDLGAFNIGIIVSNRTIKQALQDLETAVNARMFAGNNLSDLPNKATARTNLELGSASTRNIGTSGSTVPLLNTINTWSGKQSFSGATNTTGLAEITSVAGTVASVAYQTGSNLRWAISKSSDTESGSNAGSQFVITRYADNGTTIDNPLTISRSTGVVTLSQALPLTSGGTGGNSLGSARTSLQINNVDNTSDINKPVSTAQATALSGKLDKTGGNLSGALYSSGSITSDSYIRSAGSLVAAGGASEGGQIVLGYRTYSTIAGEAAGTWNLDVDNVNVFRIFARRANDTGTGPLFSITENGDVATQNLTVTGNGNIANFRGSGSQYQGLTIRNGFGSASQTADSFITFENENGLGTAAIGVNTLTNGSSSISFGVTAPGSRSSDRKTYPVNFTSDAANFSIPINGRAYPRRSDGSSINFIWTGQNSTPSWIIGSNNGSDFYPFNPNNVNVGQLNGVTGGSQGGYIRRGDDISINGALSSQIVVAGNSVTDDVWSSPIQIREVNHVGNSQSASTYAPSLAFHWGQRTASAIKMWSDGSLRFQVQGSSGAPATVYLGDMYSTGTIRLLNDAQVYWSGRGRGINVSDAGSGYGHITVTGNGQNAWAGYSIGTWASFMGNGTEVGIYSQQYSNWLLRFDSARNAIFAQNVTAYSDERLKKNKRPIPDVTHRREGMAKAAIMYERDGETKIGFGAQTLEPYVPEVVFTQDDLTGTKTVDYASTVAILAVDNQILSDRLDILTKENEDLKTKYADLLMRLEKAGI